MYKDQVARIATRIARLTGVVPYMVQVQGQKVKIGEVLSEEGINTIASITHR